MIECQIKRTLCLLDFVGLKNWNRRVLGRKIDLLVYSTIEPVVKENIEQTGVYPMIK
jgi:predicted nucleotidyltransferase